MVCREVKREADDLKWLVRRIADLISGSMVDSWWIECDSIRYVYKQYFSMSILRCCYVHNDSQCFALLLASLSLSFSRFPVARAKAWGSHCMHAAASIQMLKSLSLPSPPRVNFNEHTKNCEGDF